MRGKLNWIKLPTIIESSTKLRHLHSSILPSFLTCPVEKESLPTYLNLCEIESRFPWFRIQIYAKDTFSARQSISPLSCHSATRQANFKLILSALNEWSLISINNSFDRKWSFIPKIEDDRLPEYRRKKSAHKHLWGTDEIPYYVLASGTGTLQKNLHILFVPPQLSVCTDCAGQIWINLNLMPKGGVWESFHRKVSSHQFKCRISLRYIACKCSAAVSADNLHHHLHILLTGNKKSVSPRRSLLEGHFVKCPYYDPQPGTIGPKGCACKLVCLYSIAGKYFPVPTTPSKGISLFNCIWK